MLEEIRLERPGPDDIRPAGDGIAVWFPVRSGFPNAWDALHGAANRAGGVSAVHSTAGNYLCVDVGEDQGVADAALKARDVVMNANAMLKAQQEAWDAGRAEQSAVRARLAARLNGLRAQLPDLEV